MRQDLDAIWKALADETRRSILDFLRHGPRTTTEIVERFSKLTRFGVMKHLDVLRQAGLVLTHQDGRRRINALNAAPIRMIYERWVSRYADYWANTLVRQGRRRKSHPGDRPIACDPGTRRRKSAATTRACPRSGGRHADQQDVEALNRSPFLSTWQRSLV
jgi:DNA-binding transcriptional ArsR family regulator